MSKKKIAMTTTSAEEAPMSTTPTTTEPDRRGQTYTGDTDLTTGMALETAEMTESETIETLVRTDEEHLTGDEPALPPLTPGLVADDFKPERDLADGRSLEGKDATRVARTQGTIGMFHVLSQIGDGVFVAWSHCRNGSGHPLHECTCKGGPKEPHYVTMWREEWITKRDKEMAKAVAALKKDARRDVAALIDGPPSTVDDGLEAATEAVTAAASEEEPSE